MVVRRTVERTRLLLDDANRILSRVESSKSRIITLDSSYRELGNLSVKQDDLFRQALGCIEANLFRAAHVMAWAAFMDFLHEKLGEDGFVQLNNARSWRVKTSEDLREQSDHAVVEVGRVCGLYGRTIMKALHGLLNKRNECAHPDEYCPDLNDTLGYINELFKRLEALQGSTL